MKSWRFKKSRIAICVVLVVAVVSATSCHHERDQPIDARPNIVLVSLDTLRADHLGLYGYHRDTSPSLDRLAGEAVVFDHAVAQCSHTLDSHMSLFQSRYPTRTGEQMPILAELLSESGYRTAAFTGGGLVAASFGFGRGFELYEETGGGLGESVAMMVDWLDTVDIAEPFLVFLHSYDVHVPYDPSPPYDELFVRPYNGPVVAGKTTSLQRQYMGLDPPDEAFLAVEWNEADRHQFEALYDAGVREIDSHMARLLEFLDRSPVWSWEKDVLVVFSDHGEEFWDHGSVGHGMTLYEELIRVVLIVRFPGIKKSGARVRQTVELMDVVPTLLSLADVQVPAEFSGASLMPIIERDQSTEGHRAAVSLTVGGLRSITAYPWKLIYSAQSDTELLFNLSDDPRETTSLAGERPEVVEVLKNLLSSRLSGYVSRDSIVDESEIEDPALLEQLRALGYVADE